MRNVCTLGCNVLSRLLEGGLGGTMEAVYELKKDKTLGSARAMPAASFSQKLALGFLRGSVPSTSMHKLRFNAY